MTVQQLLQIAEKRDKAAKAEQILEDDIFSIGREFTDSEKKKLIHEYRSAKDKRAHWSVEYAIQFLDASDDEKREATEKWKETSEGKRKQATTGIRGKGVDKDDNKLQADGSTEGKDQNERQGSLEERL